ncbi:MAG: hypothetical protein U0821_18690 [Chloroflexota bacterium]
MTSNQHTLYRPPDQGLPELREAINLAEEALRRLRRLGVSAEISIQSIPLIEDKISGSFGARDPMEPCHHPKGSVPCTCR